jgi:flagellar biosynthesis/type III secretory pathway protein FliH
VNDDSPVPLFAVLLAGTRPLGEAVQQQPMPALVSSWLPLSSDPGIAVDDRAEKAAALAAKELAIAEGRAQGMAETAALRETLKTLLAELAAASKANTAKTAETIADCAIAAIEGFVETAPKQELFAPVIEAWIARAGTAPATAKVHPGGVVALQAAIGDAPIAVEVDATMAPGDLKIRGESLDTSHDWRERLKTLRDVIATALEAA